MKAAQALLETIHLDRLVATLMQVAIENVGAETGALVLLEADRFTVMAQCSGSRQCNLEKLAVTDCATIPVSVIHSVERTQETLVLDDAVSEPPFSTDPYIQKQQTRSLLCMPILQQSQLIGILYLENNLSTGVFTNDRLQVLKLLIAQAAISLENAQLYEQLADYAETLERKVEEQTQALQQEIAERQQTEAALRQSEANYRNLLQTANSVIICYDMQGRIRYINDYGVKLLGYEEHEIVGRTVFETIVPEAELSGRDMRPFVHALLRNPQSYPQGEGENLCRDGRRVWMSWSNQAIFNEQGEVVEILSVGNDTTQRKQAEEALQRSEAQFRNIFENSQVGIFRVRLCDGLILNANQRLANLLGFDSPEEIIGLEHSIDYFVNPSDRQQFLELLKRDREVRSYEAQMRKRDGTAFWVLFSCYLNAADGYIEGVVADVSDCKRAEVALQASESKLRTLIKAVPDPLFVLTGEGRFLEIIVQKPNLLWQPIEEMMGKTMHQLEKEQADEFLSYIQQVLRTQQILTVEYSAFLNGREAWFSARIAPIDDDQVIWLTRDITQRKQAEEALQRSEAKFRNIFENSQVGIYRTRLCDGLILNANQRFANLLGFDSPEKIIGLEHSIDYFVNPSDRQHAIEVMKRDGELRSYEAQMRKRDGTLFWGLCSSYLNAADGYVEGVLADISDRKRAEVALQTSEERLRLALTASNQGLYDMNLKTEEIVVNPEYALMLGYEPATFHETKSRWTESLHPDDRESMVAIYDGFITN